MRPPLQDALDIVHHHDFVWWQGLSRVIRSVVMDGLSHEFEIAEIDFTSKTRNLQHRIEWDRVRQAVTHPVAKLLHRRALFAQLGGAIDELIQYPFEPLVDTV